MRFLDMMAGEVLERTLHYKRPGSGRTLCGRPVADLEATANPSQVDCSDCEDLLDDMRSDP